MTTRILVPSKGIASWQALLAEPDLHWKRTRSAMELAVSWELAARTTRGLPSEVAAVLDLHPSTRGAVLVLGIPEHQVDLPGGRRPSQTDLWAVVRAGDQVASVAVEGKAGEAFGPTVAEWLEDASAGKRTRLDSLCRTLGLTKPPDGALRYQLLHRAASAVIEAERIGATIAVLLVQNFLRETESYSDYERFVAGFDVVPRRNGICAASLSGHELLFSWVDSAVATDAQLSEVDAAVV